MEHLTPRFFASLTATILLTSLASAQSWSGGGADDDFSTAGNWVGGVAPDNDGTATASLTGSTRTSPVLDIDYSLDTLNITSTGFTLTGSNTLTLSSGLLKNNTAHTSFTASVPIALGGDLAIGGSGTNGSIYLNGVVSGGHGITFSGGSLFMAGTNTFTGNIQIDSGGVYMGNIAKDAVGSLASGVNVSLGSGANFAFNRSGSVTYDGVISGSGSSFNAFGVSGGSGATALTVTLTNQSTYTGGTSVTGTLVVGVNNALPTSTKLALSSNGTLDANFDQTVGNMSGGTGSLIDIASDKTFTSNLTDDSTTGGTAGAGTVVLTGDFDLQTYDEWEHTGGTTITDTNLIIGAGFSYGGIVGDITNNGTVTIDKSNSMTYSDSMSGSGSLVKKGNDTLLLTGANSVSGNHTVEAGTLRIGAGGTTGSLAGNITINSGATVNFSRSDDLTFSGQLAGAGDLAKNSAGTLTLSGTGTYSGTMTINSGTLAINGSFASADATLNTTMLGSGTLHDVTTTSGSVISGGAMLATGTLTLNDLTLAGGSQMTVEMLNAGGTAGAASGWDLLSVGGALDLSGASSGSPINVLLDSLSGVGTNGAAIGFSDDAHYSWNIISGASSVVGFSADIFSINTGSFDNSFTGTFGVTQVGNDIRLNYTSTSAVPEPASYATFVGLIVMGLAARRRRRT